MNKISITFIFVALILLGCRREESTDIVGDTSAWEEPSRWFDSGKPVNENYADVFYLVSTEILDEKDENGNDSYIGKLSKEEIESIKGEMAYMQNVFGDSLNFFSPYYKQFTFSALSLPENQMQSVRAEASSDAVDAFRYYIRHLNNGRPFVLAGFSQGAMHMIDVLSQMSADEYERMVVAYSMGYRLSAKDLSLKYVKAAQSADDKGTIVSFNSVATPDALWDVVNANAATCINPVNYRTDSEPAQFVFENDTLTVSVDTVHNVLIVNSPNIDNYHFPLLDDYCKPGNLHHWDILFYCDAIRKNALKRAYKQ